MSDSPTPRRRWFRFGLRTLLVLLTVAAIGSWLYWDGWERWRWYQEQTQFVEAAKLIKVGATSHEIATLLPVREGASQYEVSYPFDATGRQVCLITRTWPNAVYVIYGRVSFTRAWRRHFAQLKSLDVFRLPGVPRGYSPKTKRGRITWLLHDGPKDRALAFTAYMRDFVWIISDEQKDDVGFEYELIHSDPPAPHAEN